MPLNRRAVYPIGCRKCVNLPAKLRGKVRRLACAVRHPHYILHSLTPIAFIRWHESGYAFEALRRFAPTSSQMTRSI